MPPGTRTLLNNPYWVVTICMAVAWSATEVERWAKRLLSRNPSVNDIHVMVCDDDSMTVVAQVQGPSPLFALNQIESLWEQDLVDEIEVKPLGITPAGLERGVTVHASSDPHHDSA